MDPVWSAGAPVAAVPVAAAAPVPQTVVVHAPGNGGMLAPDHPHQLVAELGAFRARLRDYLRSNSGQHSRLNPARIQAAGPLGQSTMGSNGAMGEPHVQTHGARAGAIVQEVRLGSRVFHVYFHQDGRREVIAMPKRSASVPRPAAAATGTGGTLAPSAPAAPATGGTAAPY